MKKLTFIAHFLLIAFTIQSSFLTSNASANEKGNGQLIVKVKGEWLPLEVGVVHLSREYFGIDHLLKKSTLDSSERAFTQSFLDWMKLLKDYSPVEAKLFEAQAKKSKWIIVDGEIGIAIKEYPSQAVKFEVSKVAGVYSKAKDTIYLSVPNILELKRIEPDSRIHSPDQGFVMIHELINQIYSYESDDSKLERGKLIVRILKDYDTPAKYQAALVYAGRSNEGVSHLNTPLQLKIDTLHQIYADSQDYDINQAHDMPFKISESMIAKMEKIQEIYKLDSKPTLWNAVKNATDLAEIDQLYWEKYTPNKQAEKLDLERFFQTTSADQLYTDFNLFLSQSERLDLDFWDVLGQTHWSESFPHVEFLSKFIHYNGLGIDGLLTFQKIASAYQDFSPYVQRQIATLIRRLNGQYVSAPLNRVPMFFCMVKGISNLSIDAQTSLEVILSEQKSCAPHIEQISNSVTTKEILNEDPTEYFTAKVIAYVKTLFNQRLGFLQALQDTVTAEALWKSNPQSSLRLEYLNSIARMIAARNEFHDFRSTIYKYFKTDDNIAGAQALIDHFLEDQKILEKQIKDETEAEKNARQQIPQQAPPPQSKPPKKSRPPGGLKLP